MARTKFGLLDGQELILYDVDNERIGKIYADQTDNIIIQAEKENSKIKLIGSVAGIGFPCVIEINPSSINLGTTNSSNILVISNAGRIGVLNSSPEYTLDVNGNFRASGSAILDGNVIVGSSMVLINANQSGVPTLDGGIEIERGNYTNAVLKWDETNNYWAVSEVGDDTSPPVFHRIPWRFLHLEDTPSSYSGQRGKVVAVKSDETGLGFDSINKFPIPVRVISDDYQIANDDCIILANAYTKQITVSLLPALQLTGRQYMIKKIDDSTNLVIIDAYENETIDGELTQELTAQGDTIVIVSDGSNWFIV